MKSCFGLLLALFVLAAVLVAGGGLWYLSSSAEFARKAESKEGGLQSATPTS